MKNTLEPLADASFLAATLFRPSHSLADRCPLRGVPRRQGTCHKSTLLVKILYHISLNTVPRYRTSSCVSREFTLPGMPRLRRSLQHRQRARAHRLRPPGVHPPLQVSCFKSRITHVVTSVTPIELCEKYIRTSRRRQLFRCHSLSTRALPS